MKIILLALCISITALAQTLTVMPSNPSASEGSVTATLIIDTPAVVCPIVSGTGCTITDQQQPVFVIVEGSDASPSFTYSLDGATIISAGIPFSFDGGTTWTISIPARAQFQQAQINTATSAPRTRKRGK